MLNHGGNLINAAQKYNIALENWIDLSTGINPTPYPVGDIDPECWRRLPEDADDLLAAAIAYYGNDQLLAVSGSQAAIQAIPTLFPPASISMLTPIYEEHPQAWQRARHTVRRLPNVPRITASMTPYALLCNPNNPSAKMILRQDLFDCAKQIGKRGGTLIVDEAFIDATPENSLTPFAGSDEIPNLIVLRSLGKFFGLAGARVGFVFGAEKILHALREKLGPWSVSNPSRIAAKRALEDVHWQKEMRQSLFLQSIRLKKMLSPLGEVSQTALFCAVKMECAAQVAARLDFFARHAILTRHYEGGDLLRFGLPQNEKEWQKLGDVIAAIAAS